MKYRSDKKSGFTLIEAILYISLISILLSGFIQFAFAMHFEDIELIHDIQDSQNTD